jgi:hypothetical protein
MKQDTFQQLIEPLVTIKSKFGRGFIFDSNPAVIPIATPRPCDDCDQIVSGRTVDYKLIGLNTNKPGWIKRCNYCKLKTTIFQKRLK